MSKDAILIEAVALADEVIEYGPNEGRGLRLAGLVLRLNEAMMAGDVPMSWMPSMPPSGFPAMMPEIPKAPRIPSDAAPVDPWRREALNSLPDPEELEAMWHTLTSRPPQRLTLAPPEEQPSDPDVVVLTDGDYL